MQQGHFHPREAGEPRPFWEHPAMLAAFVVASALPLLWPDVSPLLDLPGHMGRYRVQLERYARVVKLFDPGRPVKVGLYFPLLDAWREL